MIDVPPVALAFNWSDCRIFAVLFPVVPQCWLTATAWWPSCCWMIEPVFGSDADCDSLRSWFTWALFDPLPFHWPISVACVASWADVPGVVKSTADCAIDC